MANKLTSEGLTVGSSTLTNIVRDWGGEGQSFVGLLMNLRVQKNLRLG